LALRSLEASSPRPYPVKLMREPEELARRTGACVFVVHVKKMGVDLWCLPPPYWRGSRGFVRVRNARELYGSVNAHRTHLDPSKVVIALVIVVLLRRSEGGGLGIGGGSADSARSRQEIS